MFNLVLSFLIRAINAVFCLSLPTKAVLSLYRDKRPRMKRSLYICLLCSFWLLAKAFAQTPVSGIITAAQWSKANSPYLVLANATIPANQTLTVDAGVEVRFMSGVRLTVLGNLDVAGTSQEPVVFKSNNAKSANANWQGIQTLLTGMCNINYGHFSNADTALSFHSSAVVIQSMSNTHIWSCNVGVYTENVLALTQSTIALNNIGMIMSGFSNGSTITDNRLCNYPQNIINTVQGYMCNVSNNCFCTTDPSIAAASAIGDVAVVQVDTSCMSAHIYPGDANFDHIVDMRDLLPIGMKYGAAGPARMFQNNGALTSFVAATWADTMPNGVNVANADCDGNGIVDSADVKYIRLNYGKLAPYGNGVPSVGTALSLAMPAGNLTAGDTVRIPIMLGSVDSLIQNLYGIAFSVYYDTAMTHVPSDTTQAPVWAEVANNSWAGTRNIDLIALEHSLPTKGRVDVAFTRIDKITRTGSGKVADIIVVLADDLAKQPMQKKYSFYFGNITAITSSQQLVKLGGAQASVTVQTGTWAEDGLAQHIKVLNKAATENRIEVRVMHSAARLQSVVLTNINGQEAANAIVYGTMGQLDTASLADGVYLLTIQTDEGILHQKIILSH